MDTQTVDTQAVPIESAYGEARIPSRDLAGCIAQSLRTLRDVGRHLRGLSSADSRTLDVPALARFEAFVARTNNRATSIMSALELQSLAAQKVHRVCGAGGAVPGAWPTDDIRRELRA